MTADVPRTWPRNSLDGSSLLSCPDLEAHALGWNEKWKISVLVSVVKQPRREYTNVSNCSSRVRKRLHKLSSQIAIAPSSRMDVAGCSLSLRLTTDSLFRSSGRPNAEVWVKVVGRSRCSSNAIFTTLEFDETVSLFICAVSILLCGWQNCDQALRAFGPWIKMDKAQFDILSANICMHADCLHMNSCGAVKIESGHSVMICVWIMVFSLRRVTTSAEMQMNWRCIMQFPFFPTVHIFPTVLPPECNVNWGINNAKQLNSCAMQLSLVQCARHCQCIGGALVGAALPQRGGRPSWHQPSRSHNRRLVSTTPASIKSTATSISRTTMLQCMALKDKSNWQV